MGSAADAPKPYDPKSVRSIVRWGTSSGNYSQTTEGSDSLIYAYIYPQSAPVAGRGTASSGTAWPTAATLRARRRCSGAGRLPAAGGCAAA